MQEHALGGPERAPAPSDTERAPQHLPPLGLETVFWQQQCRRVSATLPLTEETCEKKGQFKDTGESPRPRRGRSRVRLPSPGRLALQVWAPGGQQHLELVRNARSQAPTQIYRIMNSGVGGRGETQKPEF